uniref:Uncharacterized protein n=1 Tax=Arundo donax TaxID=35708 RepID=A0A0A8ZJN5_ARUDO
MIQTRSLLVWSHISCQKDNAVFVYPVICLGN